MGDEASTVFILADEVIKIHWNGDKLEDREKSSKEPPHLNDREHVFLALIAEITLNDVTNGKSSLFEER